MAVGICEGAGMCQGLPICACRTYCEFRGLTVEARRGEAQAGPTQMKHETPTRRDPFRMLDEALRTGWNTLDNVPLRGEGEFLVLTVSGLTRLARNRKEFRNPRKADGYGPERMTVVSVETGNYLGAMAWKWPDSDATK